MDTYGVVVEVAERIGQVAVGLTVRGRGCQRWKH